MDIDKQDTYLDEECIDMQALTLPTPTEYDLLRTFIINHYLDIDYERMNHFMPIMDPEKMKLTIKYIRDVFSTGCELDCTSYIASYIPTTAELALAFAVEGMKNVNHS